MDYQMTRKVRIGYVPTWWRREFKRAGEYIGLPLVYRRRQGSFKRRVRITIEETKGERL